MLRHRSDTCEVSVADRSARQVHGSRIEEASGEAQEAGWLMQENEGLSRGASAIPLTSVFHALTWRRGCFWHISVRHTFIKADDLLARTA